jgi:hypothetical protein
MGCLTVVTPKWLLKRQIDSFTSQDWHFRFASRRSDRTVTNIGWKRVRSGQVGGCSRGAAGCEGKVRNQQH